MKQFILMFIVGIISITSVFAETTIDFSSDKKNYNIEDTINLSITLQTDNTGETELSIEGIDDFQIVGKRQSQSRTNINGVQNSNFILNLSLLAAKSGTYTLGPVITGSGTGTVESNTIEIKVTGERIMVNTQLNNLQNKSEESEEEENIDDIVLDNSPSSSQGGEEIEIIPKTILGVDGEEMTDIYRDKGFLQSYALLKKILTILILVILAILAVIFGRRYLHKYLEQRKEALEQEPEEIIEEKIEINYNSLLENLQNKYLESDKEIFYGKTGEVYRTYLDDKVQQGLSKGSLKEVEGFLKTSSIEKDTKIKLLSFYNKIYFPEYNKQEDNQEERKNVLEELEKLIIVKEFK